MNASDPLDIPTFAKKSSKGTCEARFSDVAREHCLTPYHIALFSTIRKKIKIKTSLSHRRTSSNSPLSILSIYLSGLSIFDEALTAKVILLCICIGRNSSYSSYHTSIHCMLMQTFLYSLRRCLLSLRNAELSESCKATLFRFGITLPCRNEQAYLRVFIFA